MRVLIADDSRMSNAHTYIRLGLARAFAGAGHETIIWDIHSKSAIDMFDEFPADLLLAQTYNMERGLFKVISERPELRVILTGSDWSDYSDNIDINKYPIVRANSNEIKIIEKLKKETGKPNFIHCHYHNNRMKYTHHKWLDNLGIPACGIPLAADIVDYTNGEVREEFKSDIFFLGGVWQYKALTIKPYLYPLLDHSLNLNVKIFGNRGWGIPQYHGSLETKMVKHASRSAKVCPNIQELHAHDFGHDINERIFKLLSNKCPVVSDYSESFEQDFFPNEEVIFAKTPKEFKENCLAVIHGDITIDTQKGYNKVMGSETYFHRCSEIFSYLGLEDESRNVLEKYNAIREGNGL